MSPLSVVNVIHGKRYWFRLVSISCDPGFLFSIDQHMLMVIEADGISTQPVVVDSIEIFSGQRYSVCTALYCYYDKSMDVHRHVYPVRCQCHQ